MGSEINTKRTYRSTFFDRTSGTTNVLKKAEQKFGGPKPQKEANKSTYENLSPEDKQRKIDEGMRLLMDQHTHSTDLQDPKLTYALDVQDLKPIENLEFTFKNERGIEQSGKLSVIPISITVKSSHKIPGLRTPKEGRGELGGFKWLVEIEWNKGDYSRTKPGIMIFTKHGFAAQWQGMAGAGEEMTIRHLRQSAQAIKDKDERVLPLISVLETFEKTGITPPPLFVPPPGASKEAQAIAEKLNRRFGDIFR